MNKPERLLRLPEVLERVGMSRSPLYVRIKDKTFPAPVKNGRMSLWPESVIDQYIKNLCANGDNMRNAA